MPSATRTISISRPIADVFTFVADGAKAQQWRSGVLDIAHISGKGVGEQWRQGVKGPGGRRIAADFEITVYEPPALLEFKATAGLVRPSGGYRLEALGAHSTSTQLTFWLKEELGGWKKLLLSGSVQKTMEAEMAALDRLKSVLEAL
jgi:uncharacterized protein YndB with AHSA1/START domain